MPTSIPLRTSLLSMALLLMAGVSSARAVTLAPRVSASPVRSWQVPAAGWTKANKELGRVDDVLRLGLRVYLGGNFTTVADHSGSVRARSHLAAVSATTGGLLTFHPAINGRVYALAASPDGRYLYVGGAFSSVNGVPRHNVAAFVTSTGALATRLGDMRVTGQVHALAATGTSLYLGGTFSSVAGHARSRLAKLVLIRSGRLVLSGWAPTANADVRDMVVVPSIGRLVAAGTFTSVNSRAENRIAALGTLRGRLLAWASHPSSDVLDICVSGGTLYAAVAGPGGTAVSYAVAPGSRHWYYKTDGNIQAVATVGGYPVFGMHGDWVARHRDGQLSTSARIERHKLFMLSPSGVLQAWNPDVTSTAGVLGVWALRGSYGSVYAGGDFTAVHGLPQQRFAILRGS